ncbi:hypothetical protein Btru_033309 [Bulinus truncatus]|nr:hypothetical protein Btru_033309 [Bulinus truncatus]
MLLSMKMAYPWLVYSLIIYPGTYALLPTFIKMTINGQNYSLSNYKTNFENAKVDCRSNGGELALFDNNDEYFAVMVYLADNFLSYSNVWIDIRAQDTDSNGIYDLFSWRNENFGLKVWENGEPNDGCVRTVDVCCARIGLSVKGLMDRFTDNTYNFLCKVTNECAENNGKCSQICTDLDIGFVCSCRVGFSLATDSLTCKDVDECNIIPSPCSQTCVNSIGSYTCKCLDGYTSGVNGACVDVDECSKGQTTSEKKCQQICNNTPGSYFCGCRTGYMLSTDSISCTDVDECATSPTVCNGVCTNMDGGFLCECLTGYRWTQGVCVDINECEQHSSNNCSHRCNNTMGSYTCYCDEGFNMAPDNVSCITTDHCLSETPLCDHECHNTNDTYICTCRSGYYLDPADHRKCEDINECARDNGLCEHTCNNMPGSYQCTCPLGQTLSDDGHACVIKKTPEYCPCSCSSIKLRPQSNEILRKQIVAHLTVPVKSLSFFQNQLNSKNDPRPSSTTIGYLGILLVTLVFGLLISSDVFTLVKIIIDHLRPLIQSNKNL